MNTKKQIDSYIGSHAEPKRNEIKMLNELILRIQPNAKLWFLDGKNDDGKVVSNPSIGYGSYIINYADGSTKEFFRVGVSANKTGISVYVMGIDDKSYLADTYGNTIGKATVTGYCIKFRTLKDINVEVLESAIRFRFAEGQ